MGARASRRRAGCRSATSAPRPAPPRRCGRPPSESGAAVGAVVSRGGRPDLAADALPRVRRADAADRRRRRHDRARAQPRRGRGAASARTCSSSSTAPTTCSRSRERSTRSGCSRRHGSPSISAARRDSRLRAPRGAAAPSRSPARGRCTGACPEAAADDRDDARQPRPPSRPHGAHRPRRRVRRHDHRRAARADRRHLALAPATSRSSGAPTSASSSPGSPTSRPRRCPPRSSGRVERVPGVAAAAPILVVAHAIPTSSSILVFGAGLRSFLSRRLVMISGTSAHGDQAMVGVGAASALHVRAGGHLTIDGPAARGLRDLPLRDLARGRRRRRSRCRSCSDSRSGAARSASSPS